MIIAWHRGRISSRCTGIWNDETEEAMRQVVSMCKAYAPETAMGIQLAHAGRKASTLSSRDKEVGC